MTEFDRKLLAEKIIKGLHGLGDTVIVLAASSMEKRGYPQLYIRRITRATGELKKDIWVRVADMDNDLTELEYFQCKDIDRQLQMRGEQVITVKTEYEAEDKICHLLEYDLPDPEDLYGL